MVFEDFHHADRGLIDFVDHLLEWSRSYPIYVVTLARPELLERRPAGAPASAASPRSSSSRCRPRRCGELLAGLVPGLPEVAERAIVARADGVPLYAVETVRMLLVGGPARPEGGAYRPTGDLTTLAVPETLTALIASRLDALPTDDRALASDAAVLGQSFTLAGLAVGQRARRGRPRADACAPSCGREILTLESDPRSPERGQYAFVQALIREVAYNALAKRDRKARHLAAARFFESLGTDEVAGGLAGHYLAAFRNSAEGPEADAVAAQARIALTAAAQRAAALGSHDQALTFLEQALTVTTDPAETARLLERAGSGGDDRRPVRGRGGAPAAGDRRCSASTAIGRRSPGRPRRSAALLTASYRITDAIALLEPAAGRSSPTSRRRRRASPWPGSAGARLLPPGRQPAGDRGRRPRPRGRRACRAPGRRRGHAGHERHGPGWIGRADRGARDHRRGPRPGGGRRADVRPAPGGEQPHLS